MTLVSAIVRQAYRESNLIAITADPTADELSEGLDLLNSYVASLYGNNSGEELDTILIGRGHVNKPSGYPWYDQIPDQTDWYVPPNVRMALNLTSPQTVYLDPNPSNGQRFAFMDLSNNLSTNNFTIVGNGRLINGALQEVVILDGANKEYMYRDDIGTWVVIQPFILTDIFPFPTDFDDFFATALSFRLNPRHAVTADSQTISVFKQGMQSFTARYRQHRQVGSELALIRTLGVPYRQRWGYGSNYAQAAFNSGYPYPGQGPW